MKLETMPFRSSVFALVGFLLAAALQVESFAVVSPKSLRPVATRLDMSSVPRENDTPSSSQERPAWINLPMRRSDEDKLLRAADNIEIVVGRVAMLGSLILLSQELLTGESIQEQVVNLAGVLLN